MKTFQRLAQNYILGTASFRYWLCCGVTEDNRAFSFSVPQVPSEDSDSPSSPVIYGLQSDGNYLYFHTSAGLLKVGTGYGFTVMGYLYCHNPHTFGDDPRVRIMHHKVSTSL